MAKKLVNKRGWWGILLHASWPTWIALIITAVVFTFAVHAEAGLSAFVAGVIVWILSAISVLVIALVWQRQRNLAIPLAMGAFVAKLVILGFLLTVIAAPAWLHTVGAAIGALVAIVVWQVSEVIVFINTRRLIYS